MQLVDDVEPYELMKLRLLNASHQALCYLGYLSGLPLRPRGLPGPAVRRLPARLHGARGDADAARRCPGVDLDAYSRQLIERFANPEVRDTLARLCAESSDRIPKWLVPVIRENLAHRRARSTGPRWWWPSWARYAEGVDEQGEPIEVVDRLKDAVMARGRPRRARTRWPSSATATCSATSSTTSGSPRPTPPPSTRCTPRAPGPRWSPGRASTVGHRLTNARPPRGTTENIAGSTEKESPCALPS